MNVMTPWHPSQEAAELIEEAKRIDARSSRAVGLAWSNDKRRARDLRMRAVGLMKKEALAEMPAFDNKAAAAGEWARIDALCEKLQREIAKS